MNVLRIFIGKRCAAWIVLTIASLIGPMDAQAQVILELIDPVSGTNTMTLPSGQPESLFFEIVVTGLTAEQPLNGFSVTAGEYINGPQGTLDVSGYTSLLPAGWSQGAPQYTASFSGQNISGSDLSGTVVLGTLSFTIGSDWQSTESAFFYFDSRDEFGQPQFLHDSNGTDIPYSFGYGLIQFVSTPEPSTYALFLLGSLLLFARCFRPIVETGKRQ